MNPEAIISLVMGTITITLSAIALGFQISKNRNECEVQTLALPLLSTRRTTDHKAQHLTAGGYKHRGAAPNRNAAIQTPPITGIVKGPAQPARGI
jgi:hypothetical protein